jgi:hypothetical protein
MRLLPLVFTGFSLLLELRLTQPEFFIGVYRTKKAIITSPFLFNICIDYITYIELLTASTIRLTFGSASSMSGLANANGVSD